MAFTPLLIGYATGSAVTSLTVTVNHAGGIAAGGQILVAVAIDQPGFDGFSDSVGNTYNQAAGSARGVGAYVLACENNLALPNHGTLTLDNTVSNVPFSGSVGIFAVSGLTSVAIVGSSAGQGSDTHPSVALDSVPSGDWMVGIAAVGGPSSDGFTQDPAWSNPGNFNSQTTTTFTAYAAYKQSAGGQAIYAPTLGVARSWAALLVALAA